MNKATVADVKELLAEALDIVEQGRQYWSRAFSTGPKSYKLKVNQKGQFDMYNIYGHRIRVNMSLDTLIRETESLERHDRKELRRKREEQEFTLPLLHSAESPAPIAVEQVVFLALAEV